MRVFLSVMALLPGVLASLPAHALTPEDQCLLDNLHMADATATVGNLRQQCQSGTDNPQALPAPVPVAAPAALPRSTPRPASVATGNEAPTVQYAYKRYALLPYRPTYLLPWSYNNHPNDDSYLLRGEHLDHAEVKLQLSMKVPLALDLFGENGDLLMAYTQVSWWQAYNHKISSPFRETNYEPELFADFHRSPRPDGSWQNTHIQFGLNHQSNGQDGTDSRSWNRLFANFIWEKDDLLVSFKPWWRIPERSKHSATDPGGDDNPHMEQYMGYGELMGLYRDGNSTWTLMLRNNFRSENKGAVQLDWSFPVARHLRGHVQYFSGYGESLIDYNDATDRLSLGVEFSDWLF